MRFTVTHRRDTVAMKSPTATVASPCAARVYMPTVADRCDVPHPRACADARPHTHTRTRARAEIISAQLEPSRRCATVRVGWRRSRHVRPRRGGAERLANPRRRNPRAHGPTWAKRARGTDVKRQLADAIEQEQWSADALEVARQEIVELRGRIDAAQPADVAGTMERLKAAEGTNQKVRANAQRATLLSQEQATAEEALGLTKAITAIDADKAARLAAAPFPVPGLGIDENGVTFGGLPFSQASSAEQLRVSVAMGLAMNPKLRVLLVRDASLLDDDSRALIAEMAEAADAQLWMEVVGDGEAVSVVIEDGAVRLAPGSPGSPGSTGSSGSPSAGASDVSSAVVSHSESTAESPRGAVPAAVAPDTNTAQEDAVLSMFAGGRKA